MPDLLIKEDELNQLDALIGNLPYRQAQPIVQTFQAIHQKRLAEEQAARIAASAPAAELTAIPGGKAPEPSPENAA